MATMCNRSASLHRSLLPAVFCVTLLIAPGAHLPLQATTPDSELPPLNKPLPTLPLEDDAKAHPLTLAEAIELALGNSRNIELARLELERADTELRLERSQYAPLLGLGYEGSERRERSMPSNQNSGSRINHDTYTASIAKLFSSGTHIELSASDHRFDSNSTQPQPQPPLHTGSARIALRQELWRNAFGYSQRRREQIARNRAEIVREDVTWQISEVVVTAIIDYLEMALAREELRSSEMLLNSRRDLRNITRRRVDIGMAELFEVNQWNGLVATAENRVASARADFHEKRRKLLRTLNLPSDLALSGGFEELTPQDLTTEADDIARALELRPDMRNISRRRDNARLEREVAENSRRPSVTIGGSYASRDYGRHAHTARQEIPRGSYPEATVEFRVEYPLWDEGLRVGVRNARIEERQLTIVREILERSIADEVRDARARIDVAAEALKRSVDMERQAQIYYNGLVGRYRQGRFATEAMRSGLDELIEARRNLVQARVDYHVALLRLHLVRNSLFEEFGIDIEQHLRRSEVAQ